MMISRKLAHKVQGRLQLILAFVETEQDEKAVREIQELATFLNAHIESKDEERARHTREEQA